MRKYRVLLKADNVAEPSPLGTFDTLLEANTWIQDEGSDDAELGTYDVEVVEE